MNFLAFAVALWASGRFEGHSMYMKNLTEFPVWVGLRADTEKSITVAKEARGKLQDSGDSFGIHSQNKLFVRVLFSGLEPCSYWGSINRGPKDHINTRIARSGRILTFMWSFGALSNCGSIKAFCLWGYQASCK